MRAEPATVQFPLTTAPAPPQVSKTEEYEWSVLKPDIFAAIMDHFAAGEPLFTDPTARASDTAILDTDTEVPLACACACVLVTWCLRCRV